MNPPLRTEEDRQSPDRRAARRHDRLHRDRPRAARARREGGAVRAGADGHHRPGDVVRGAAHRARRPRRSCRSACWSSGMTAGAALFDLPIADDRQGRAGRPGAGRPRRRVDRRRARLGEPLGQLVLRRPAPEGPRRHDDRRRRRRLPRARVHGGGQVSLLAARPHDPGRHRPPGGLPALRAFDRAVAGGCAKLVAGGPRPRRPDPRHRAVPQGPRRHRGRGRPRRPRRASRRPSSPPCAPTASTSAAATRRWSAASRPTSASPRPSTTCSTAASRSTSPPTPSARATQSTTTTRCRACEQAGAVVTTIEAALLELCERAGTPEFKAVQK